MNFQTTTLPGVVKVIPRIFTDSRGFFLETFQSDKFTAAGLPIRIVQENVSRSVKGVIRGLHYQIEQAQGKLVRVLHGRIFDVAVDMRRSSPHFGKWVGEWLDDVNQCALWVPPGFAHGFLAVTESFVQYACTELYAPKHERSLLWRDPAIGVEWPLDGIPEPVVSSKDADAPTLDRAETYP